MTMFRSQPRFKIPSAAARVILEGMTKVHNTVPEIHNPITKKPCGCNNRFDNAKNWLEQFIVDDVLPGEAVKENSNG